MLAPLPPDTDTDTVYLLPGLAGCLYELWLAGTLTSSGRGQEEGQESQDDKIRSWNLSISSQLELRSNLQVTMINKHQIQLLALTESCLV